MKTCTSCHAQLQPGSFHRDSAKSDGYYPSCKDCRRKKNGSEERIPAVVIGTYNGMNVVRGKPYPYLQTSRIRIHRYIMEEELGRRLLPGEHVHHIDSNKENYSIENLTVLTASDHHKLHPTPKCRDGLWQTCIECGKRRWEIPFYIQRRFRGDRKRAAHYWCSKCSGNKGGQHPLWVKLKIRSMIR